MSDDEVSPQDLEERARTGRMATHLLNECARARLLERQGVNAFCAALLTMATYSEDATLWPDIVVMLREVAARIECEKGKPPTESVH